MSHFIWKPSLVVSSSKVSCCIANLYWKITRFPRWLPPPKLIFHWQWWWFDVSTLDATAGIISLTTHGWNVHSSSLVEFKSTLISHLPIHSLMCPSAHKYLHNRLRISPSPQLLPIRFECLVVGWRRRRRRWEVTGSGGVSDDAMYSML